jgi:type III secretion system YscQ/HrcQ family protein
MRLRADFEVIETTYIVATKASLGFVRLVVPLHMISNLELFSRHEASRRSARRRIERTETGSMPHTLPVSLGSVPLEISELSSLRSGDVLLPAAHGVDFEGLAPEGGGGRLFVDRRMRHHMRCTLRPLEAQGDNRARRDGWSIEIDDRALVSTRTEEQGDSAMSDETGAAAADADEKTEYLMDMAGVEVEFLVGSLEISIRELASLQSGQVLELERDLAEPLDLVVDGRRVARGELVNVEGRLGVRIVSVGSR